MKRQPAIVLVIVATVLAWTTNPVWALESLASWADTGPKKALVAFVERVTKEGSPDFVAPPDRIAVFDNDGTLWAEQPVYFQFFFGIDRIKALAPQHPEWKEKPLLKAAMEGDLKGVLSGGVLGLNEIIMSAHAEMTNAEFGKIVNDWLAASKHPRFHRPYTDLAYQPMLETLTYLRANGFKTYIVSGGGLEFMRPWTERVYGVPPEQVIGSSTKLKFERREGKPVVVRTADLNVLNDREAKVLSIEQIIGRRPIAAFGNSDGDLPMLEWTAAGEGARFCLYVHHTDAEREWAYDRNSGIGRLDKGLDEAQAKGWPVVDMKQDWKRVFPFEK